MLAENKARRTEILTSFEGPPIHQSLPQLAELTFARNLYKIDRAEVIAAIESMV
jgi:hypothetical protein